LQRLPPTYSKLNSEFHLLKGTAMHSSPLPSASRFSAGPSELRREFVLADLDHDHRLNYAEFCKLLSGLEAGMSERDLHIGFREVDTDRDGLISCDEFIAWWRAD
jgi:Ca2+-binding EF-hand superfamily protein